MISGKRLPLDDPELLKLVNVMDHLTLQSGQQKAIDAFPWLRFVAPRLSGWTEMKSDMDSLLAFIEETMKPYLGSYNNEGISNF